MLRKPAKVQNALLRKIENTANTILDTGIFLGRYIAVTQQNNYHYLVPLTGATATQVYAIICYAS